MFGIVLTIAYSALLGYVLWRSVTVPGLARWLSGKRVLWLGAVLWMVFFMGRYLGHDASGVLAGRYEIEGMTVILSRGAGTWGPRMRLWHRGEIVSVILHAGKPAG